MTHPWYDPTVFRFLAAASLVVMACDSPQRVSPTDAPVDAPTDAFVSPIDAPPPSSDAGPPPMVSCSTSAPTCELPPSTCLDPNYLIYYTGGTCVDDSCQYMTNLLYCPIGCVNGGCQGGFT